MIFSEIMSLSYKTETYLKAYLTLQFYANKKGLPCENPYLTEVGNTGFEPVTSCLSSKRSKPTELIAQKKSLN